MANGNGPPAASPRGGILPRDPRRRRLVIAGGAAMILALIFLLQRRGDTGAAAGQEETGFADPVAADPLAGSTFADNGEAFGGFTTAVTEALGGVQFAIDDLRGASDAQSTRIDEQFSSFGDLIRTSQAADAEAAAAVAPGPLGQTNATGAQATQPRVDRFGRTLDDRNRIRAERQAGTVDRFGRTPTERALARRNPAYKRELRGRLNQQRRSGEAPPRTGSPAPPRSTQPPPRPQSPQRGVSWATWTRWNEAQRARYRARHRTEWNAYRPR